MLDFGSDSTLVIGALMVICFTLGPKREGKVLIKGFDDREKVRIEVMSVPVRDATFGFST